MDGKGTAFWGKDISAVQQSLSEGRTLEKWQKYFCDIAQVFVCSTDNYGIFLTELGGKYDEAEKIRQVIDHEQLQSMLRRVSEGVLEEQAIEETAYANLRIAAISVKMEGKPVLNWLVCGILSDIAKEEAFKPVLEGFETKISEKRFARTVDAIRNITELLLCDRLQMLQAQAESRRSRSAEQEMRENLHRSEALTQILQFLEAEGAIENVMRRLLKAVGQFLHVSAAQVYRITKQGEHETVAEWRERPQEEAESEQLVFPAFLQSDKTRVISSNTALGVQEKEQLQNSGMKAVIVIPVVVNGAVIMYAGFCQLGKERVWGLEEIRFLNDAVKILQSILARRIQKNSLAGSFASLETILDNVGSYVYVHDLEDGRGLFANRNTRQDFEMELKDGSLAAFLTESPYQGGDGTEIYYDKRKSWYDLYEAEMKWVDGRQVRLYALYDITEKKVSQKKIEQQAYTDFLTGLFNRMCCERDLARYVEEAKATGKNGALLYLDLDDFKHINDGLGHQYGDVLLKAISHSLRRIPGITDTCYRMGGDEFVIVVPPAEYPAFEMIIDSIRAIFLKPWFLKDADYYCTMSMGVVEFPSEGDVVHELIRKADIAMYEAKKHGKNRIAQYSDSLEAQSGKRLDMEKNMRDAARGGCEEFEIYLQPIIDIQKEGLPCTGAEALIRWNSTELGFISPAEFIPLAEYLGLINPIGNYVLKEACRYCHAWNQKGYPDYKINVNLSVVQLLQTDIVEIVERTIKETGINPKNLTLEVTESLAINDMERMKSILGSIKKLGVRIALDDFGTGYSSLNHIREIPFDVIKVDQSFIRDLEQDSYAKSFIQMVGQLAEAIDVNLCIEGVETKRQYEELSKMHVSLVQGYYFDRPMPKEEFEKKYTPEIFSL